MHSIIVNLYIKEVGKKSEDSEYGVMYILVMNEKEEVVYKSSACFLYADDIVLLSITMRINYTYLYIRCMRFLGNTG